jgi:hypothetical protein
MAWIAIVPPSPVTRMSATRTAPASVRLASSPPGAAPRPSGGRALERAGRERLPRPTEPDPGKARTLFGEVSSIGAMAPPHLLIKLAWTSGILLPAIG